MTTSALRADPPISNRTLGMMLLIGSETVLFSCLISAYIVLRMAAAAWPPAGTPALALRLSVINTGVLLISAVYAFGAGVAARAGHLARTRIDIGMVIGFGVLFLILQGIEFQSLYARGLTLHTGPYGAIFFTLAGCHGLHVIGGLAYALVVWIRAQRTEEACTVAPAVRAAALYWYFVTLVWLVLFGILYIV